MHIIDWVIVVPIKIHSVIHSMKVLNDILSIIDYLGSDFPKSVLPDEVFI